MVHNVFSATIVVIMCCASDQCDGWACVILHQHAASLINRKCRQRDIKCSKWRSIDIVRHKHEKMLFELAASGYPAGCSLQVRKSYTYAARHISYSLSFFSYTSLTTCQPVAGRMWPAGRKSCTTALMHRTTVDTVIQELSWRFSVDDRVLVLQEITLI